MKESKKRNSKKKTPVYAILVQGSIVAVFQDPELAMEWAREYYFGEWMMSSVSNIKIRLFSKRKLAKAKDRAKELSKLFKESKIAE